MKNNGTSEILSMFIIPLSEAAKPVKPSKSLVKEKPVDAVNMSSFADPEKFVNEILEKASAVIISEVSQT